MFKDVQQIKVKIWENVLRQFKDKKTEIQDEVVTLKKKLWHMGYELHHMELLEKNALGDFHGKKLSILKRTFSIKGRKDYQTYQRAVAEMQRMPERIALLAKEVELAEKETEKTILQSGILQAIKDAENKVWQMQQATTLSDLGITPVEAVKLLEEHHITPVLDESDLVLTEHPRNYQSKADLIAVHQMGYSPDGNQLRTAAEIGIERTEKIVLDGREYRYSYPESHNAVHMSLNGVMSNNPQNSRDECRYVVLQPLHEIPNSKIGAVMPNNTYTRGGVNLTANAWILCPKDEVENTAALNPLVHVLGYQGKNPDSVIAPFLSQLGYRAEVVGSRGWVDRESQEQLSALAEQENLPVIQYCSSTDQEDEHFQNEIGKAIAMMKMLRDENLMQTSADFEHFETALNRVGFDAAVQTLLERTNVLNPELIDHGAIVANGRQVEVFAQKMADAEMRLLPDEQSELQGALEKNGYAFQICNGITKNNFATQIMLNSAIRSHTNETERIM